MTFARAVHHSNSEAQTRQIGLQLMQALRPSLASGPVIFLLEGDLGAGKTQMVKGVAEALGIAQVISSPTYVLMKEYEFEGGLLIHADCWRMEHPSLQDLGLDTALRPGVVLAVEWPKNLATELPQALQPLVGVSVNCVWKDENVREISVTPL